MKKRTRKGLIVAGAVVLVLGLAGLVGAGGCGDKSEGYPTTVWGDREEYDNTESTAADGGLAFGDEAALAPELAGTGGADQSFSGSAATTQVGADQKIIRTAQLEVEVEAGQFQKTFNEAFLLAKRYGGEVSSSNLYASGEDDTVKSGMIEIKVPSAAFYDALNGAAGLGEIKQQSISTDDVTAEYVDLEARITNSQANVNALLVLFAKAKTVEEILQVQQTLNYAQQELEQLKGQKRYLDGHTEFSTVTLTIYETGTEVTPPSEWGFVQALKDALHNVVEAFNAVVRGLGWIIPIVVILGIIACIIYLIVRAATRRSRERRAQTAYQAAATGTQAPLGTDNKDKGGPTS